MNEQDSFESNLPEIKHAPVNIRNMFIPIELEWEADNSSSDNRHREGDSFYSKNGEN